MCLLLLTTLVGSQDGKQTRAGGSCLEEGGKSLSRSTREDYYFLLFEAMEGLEEGEHSNHEQF